MAAEMTARERAIREERAKVYDGMVAIMEKMDKGETVTVEDRADFDKRELRLAELDGDLDRVVKFQARDAGKNEAAETRGVSRDEKDGSEESYARAYTDWFKNGEVGMKQESREALRAAPLDAASMQTLPGQGGYMIPQGFWENLQIAMKQYGGLLSLTNVIKTGTGNEMPWPTNNPTGVLGTYVTETNQVPFTDYAFGQGILYAWAISSGVVLASLQLINDSYFSVDSFITDRMGEAIGRKVAAELWAGAGSGSKALTGLTTAINAQGGSGSGLLTSPGFVIPAAAEQVPTLASPSAGAGGATLSHQLISWNSFTLMIASVDAAYRAGGRCAFVMNDAQVQRERTLTDTQGHPLWQPNTQAGQQDTILGYPVVVDNNCPDVSATPSTGGGAVFGDLKTAMVVRQVNNAGSMRLTERYADFLQVGYLSYVRMDSQPNDLRAIVEYKSGAS